VLVIVVSHGSICVDIEWLINFVCILPSSLLWEMFNILVYIYTCRYASAQQIVPIKLCPSSFVSVSCTNLPIALEIFHVVMFCVNARMLL
jgi:hypothetical protein